MEETVNFGGESVNKEAFWRERLFLFYVHLELCAVAVSWPMRFICGTIIAN